MSRRYTTKIAPRQAAVSAAGPATPSGRAERILDLLRTLAVTEGVQPTTIAGVALVRDSRPSPRRPVINEPMILFVGQGRKCAYVGGDVIGYDADHYLVLSVPVPAECEVIATPQQPLLGVKVAIDPSLLAELLVELDDSAPAANVPTPRGIHARPVQEPMRDALVRLLEALRSPRDARILGRGIVRELVYRVLQDEPGSGLRALAARDDRFLRVARVLQHVHADCTQMMGSARLAKLAGMSVTTFHHAFKAVTATSPLQYVKSVRLHRARMLMVHEGHTAATAAAAVGYESPSQFGREWKRLFGNTPTVEVAQLRARLVEDGARVGPVASDRVPTPGPVARRRERDHGPPSPARGRPAPRR
jgi:AraC-like DNA-binding protein